MSKPRPPCEAEAFARAEREAIQSVEREEEERIRADFEASKPAAEAPPDPEPARDEAGGLSQGRLFR